jgi:hypothetical protein
VTLAVTVFAADAAERHGLHEHARLLRAVAGRRTEAADACARAADACGGAASASAAAACAAAACAGAADACAGAAAACERAANVAYHLNQRADLSAYSQTVQWHDRLAEAASWSAIAAAYSSAADDAKRRIEYFELLLDAIDEEFPATA